ncbi:hypothetical protein [Phosphitispora fastidiosa]|uniref:hypothetical protein n=1 Tax=Phosphitispora fastidiosa TaxID=2837202 RepID=UPI001E55A970|nr:hypothetical protein [Phosphitispora fastidiosa]MBU7007170.1 hypothetical protein [Phosphitispora fastidiosa]
MCFYYYDEERGIAYKVTPVKASVASSDESIVVHTDVKVTNLKKEKIRRTLSQMYPSDQYDLDSAKKIFADTMLSRFISGARKISEQEYQTINSRYEA